MEYETVQDVLDEQPNLALLKQLGKLRTAITTASRQLNAKDVAVIPRATV